MNSGIMFYTHRIALAILGYFLISTAQGKNFIHAFEYAKCECQVFRNSEGIKFYSHFYSGSDGVALAIAMEHSETVNWTESYQQLAKRLKWPYNIGCEYELLSFLGSRGWELITEHVMPDT